MVCLADVASKFSLVDDSHGRPLAKRAFAPPEIGLRAKISRKPEDSSVVAIIHFTHGLFKDILSRPCFT